MDDGVNEDETALPDGFFLQDRTNNALYATCSNDKFQRWNFTHNEKENVWSCTKGVSVNKSALTNYVPSWDKEHLFTYEQNKTNVTVVVTTKLNPRYLAFYLMTGATGVSTDDPDAANEGWQWTALKDAIDLLHEA